MKLAIATTSMFCGSCGLEIERGEYHGLGPQCFHCVQRPSPAPPPTQNKQNDTFLLFDDPERQLAETVKETLGATSLRFAGPDYSPKHDQIRLTKKLLMVFELMKDRRWRSINEIYAELDGLVAHTTISANLRHLRKEEFGSHEMNRRRRGEASGGLFEYQIIANEARKAA